MGEVIKSQQTELFWATAASVVNKATAITGIAGLGGAREPVDTTDLEAETDGTVIAGIARPGPVTANFNVRRGELAHRALLALRDSGEIVSWGVYSSGAATVPTAVAGVLQAASGRVSGHFMGYVSDVNIEAAGNNIWKGTISIQRSGKITWNLMTPEEEIAALFAAGEQGAWFDPSDMSTLFQDAAGTIPVTALEQPVGRMLDKSGRGNHATQATAGSRPVLSARVNLVLYTEQMNLGWSKAATGTGVAPVITDNYALGPDGKTPASRVQLDIGAGTTTTDISRIFQSVASASGGTYANSVWLRTTDGSTKVVQCRDDVATSGGDAGLLTVTGAWQQFRFSVVAAASVRSVPLWLRGGQGTSSSADLLVCQPQLEGGVSATGRYQRVGVATDYDAVGFPAYLRFDGVSSWLSTGGTDFTGTSQLALLVGLKKMSDAADGMICALGTSLSVNGSFELAGPGSGTGTKYQFASRGTAQAVPYTSAAAFAAPHTAVATAVTNISAPVALLRLNGAQVDSRTTTQGGGSFGNYPIYVGRRGGTTVPFNGNLYGLIVLGRTATGPELAAAETFMASRTGVTL